MKNAAVFISILALLGAAAGVRADDELPKRFGFDRYQKMLDHSPFAVATAGAAPVAAPDAFKGLYVANAAHTPDTDLVTIMSTDDKNLKEYVSTREPNEHGYAISSIEWSERPGETKVTISKDEKFGTLTFNQALISSPQPNGPAIPQPVQPGVTSANIPRAPARIPPLPNLTPHTRGVIPRVPAGATPRPVEPEE